MLNKEITKIEVQWPHIDYKDNPDLRASLIMTMARTIFTIEQGILTPFIINSIAVESSKIGDEDFSVGVQNALANLHLNINTKKNVSSGPIVKPNEVFDLRRIVMKDEY